MPRSIGSPVMTGFEIARGPRAVDGLRELAGAPFGSHLAPQRVVDVGDGDGVRRASGDFRFIAQPAIRERVGRVPGAGRAAQRGADPRLADDLRGGDVARLAHLDRCGDGAGEAFRLRLAGERETDVGDGGRVARAGGDLDPVAQPAVGERVVAVPLATAAGQRALHARHAVDRGRRADHGGGHRQVARGGGDAARDRLAAQRGADVAGRGRERRDAHARGRAVAQPAMRDRVGVVPLAGAAGERAAHARIAGQRRRDQVARGGRADRLRERDRAPGPHAAAQRLAEVVGGDDARAAVGDLRVAPQPLGHERVGAVPCAGPCT